MHILEKIYKFKQDEVERNQQTTSVKKLEQSIYFDRTCNSYVQEIAKGGASGVIAEFKKKSPSKQNINLTAHIEDVAPAYVTGGASAISILTDEYFFGGSNEYLTLARQLLPQTPLLRKDFVIDEYQIVEAKAIGADIILLICEILDKEEILRFARLARSLGMEVLLEMHTADQVYKCNDDVTMVGVNNRDLKTFQVDYERSKRLFDRLPDDIPKIAESGLSDPGTCHMLYEHGFRGFLIGEQFMKQEDPGLACARFIEQMTYLRNQE